MSIEARHRLVERYVAEPNLPNRNAVVNAHRYLCRRGARKFYRGTVDRADLEQVAAVGLIKASQRYSGCYDTPFEAYAWLMIVGELMHFVRDHERPVRIPRGLRSLEARCSLAYEDLSARLEREPNVAEIAGAVGAPIQAVDEVRALRSRPPCSERDGARTAPGEPIESVPDRRSAEFDLDDYLSLAHALRNLSERELRILRGIYFQERTQAQVGRELGISQRQTSRLLQRALERLAVMMSP